MLPRLRPARARCVLRWSGFARETPDRNQWLGDARARELRHVSQHIDPTASTFLRAALFLQLGRAELVAGNEREAIDALRTALQYCGGPADRRQSRPGTAQREEALFHLGVAFMRFGETQNCCERHATARSCILHRSRAAGIHTVPKGVLNQGHRVPSSRS